MNQIYTVLLVEDDKNACNDMQTYIDTLTDVQLVGVTNDSTDAVQLTRSLLPDAVILDLELNDGCGSGIQYLNELKPNSLGKRPYILVTTNTTSNYTYKTVREFGADFIMAKHQKDYSAKSVIDLLRTILSTFSKSKKSSSATTVTQDEQTLQLISSIHNELNLIGMRPNTLGYTYLTDAISYTITHPDKRYLTYLHQKHQKSEPSIIRAMQHAINRTWHIGDLDDLLLHYTARINSERGVPTISEFVYYYTNKLKCYLSL